jgi:hypothetical protein
VEGIEMLKGRSPRSVDRPMSLVGDHDVKIACR